MREPSASDIVEAVIRSRKTEKVLGDPAPAPAPGSVPKGLPGAAGDAHRAAVLGALDAAGMAPFHYPRNVDGIAEPWRAHVLWHGDAQRAAVYLRDKLGVTSKEPALCAGCHALVLATWLPEFYDPAAQQASKLSRDKQIIHDEEHLMAAAAMVQNLLLLLTAHGMGTYWSSGGALRGLEMFAYLGIPERERLLGAIFIEYPDIGDSENNTKQRVPGKLRGMRSSGWVREVGVAGA